YGSNLATPRLLQRIPDARLHKVATLSGHRLCFHKNDSGRSGKCDIQSTEDHDDIVYGIVYHISQNGKEALDYYEGHGFGYLSKTIKITTLDGDRIEALTYYAIDIDIIQQPYHWYKEHVLRGAREHDFPTEYIAMIEAQASIDDFDEQRVRRELEIYLD
ncbi:MAG: gamma-glutamylcyclotransferase, partial [Gammaproteobacteria bacterium]|nr:gamma-glutamylcyclotransferase [Gammaproteobacteria bacterium]